jgi:hypothetical protein
MVKRGNNIVGLGESERVFKTSSQAYLYAYLFFRDDFAENITNNFLAAEKNGMWDSSKAGKRALLESNHVGEDLNDMARRKLLNKRDLQYPPVHGRPRSDRKNDGYKRVLYSINPNWVIYWRDVLDPEKEELHRDCLSAIRLMRACAKDESNVISILNKWYKPTSIEIFSLFFDCVGEMLENIPRDVTPYETYPFSECAITFSPTISDNEAINELNLQYDVLIKELIGPLKQQILERELKKFNEDKEECINPERFFNTGLLNNSKINEAIKNMGKPREIVSSDLQSFLSYISGQKASLDSKYAFRKPENDENYWDDEKKENFL